MWQDGSTSSQPNTSPRADRTPCISRESERLLKRMRFAGSSVLVLAARPRIADGDGGVSQKEEGGRRKEGGGRHFPESPFGGTNQRYE